MLADLSDRAGVGKGPAARGGRTVPDMADDVIPFDPKRRRKGQPPAGREPVGYLHDKTAQATAGARQLALEQRREREQRMASQHWRQETARLLHEGRPVPGRITMALDMAGGDGQRLEGPEVDTAVGTWEGNPDGDVDAWEAAEAVPTAEQIQLLSTLTGFPVPWFYQPLEEGPLIGPAWICWTDGRGCQSPEPDWVDERGVLHYADEPPRKLPAGRPGALF